MKKRNWFQQFHILIASGIFLTILVLGYQIVERHNRRFDLTRERIHTISSETIEVLKMLKGSEINVRAFFAPEDQTRRELEVLLKELATHHSQLHFQFYDPDRLPSEAKRFGVDAYRTTVIEYANRQEKIQDFSEEAFTNALIRLAHPKSKTLCFTSGHGELTFEESDRLSLSEWKKALEERRYRIREIQLLKGEIPDSCDVVVMAGPHYELLPKEVDLLQKYPKQGKGFLLLIDPMDPGTGKSFARLVEPFGIQLTDDVVVDKVSRIFGGDFLVPIIAQYTGHPITKRFQAAVFFPVARTVNQLPTPAAGVRVTELALTAPGSWAETDLKRLENGEAEMNAEKDMPGPVSLVTVSEVQGARVAVVGDSDFLVNAHLQISGNKDFAMNILEWLARDDRWISIRARKFSMEPVFLRVNQSVGTAVFTIGALPLTTLILGSAGIWIRSRKTQ